LFIFQERDLEVELGDDYVLDLQSKKPFHCNGGAARVKWLRTKAHFLHVVVF